MKTTKRLVSCLLALAVCAAMSACGEKSYKDKEINDWTESDFEEAVEDIEEADKKHREEKKKEEATTTTASEETESAAFAFDPAVYSYYDDLAAEYEANGDNTCNNSEVVMYRRDIMIYGSTIMGYYQDKDGNGKIFIYDMNSKESKIIGTEDLTSNPDLVMALNCEDICNGYIFPSITNIDTSITTYRFDALMNKNEFNNKSSATSNNVYAPLAALSDGSMLVIDIQKAGKLVMLKNDFKTIIDIPDVQKENDHGFESVMPWNGSGPALYKNKLYAATMGTYLNIDDMTWHTFDEEGIPVVRRVIGKYIIGDNCIYDMEKDEFTVKIDGMFKGEYYGGDSNLVVRDGNLYKTYNPSQPVAGEGKPDELLMEGWDDTTCTILNNKYYIFKDEYGIFLREYGKGTDGEQVLVQF